MKKGLLILFSLIILRLIVWHFLPLDLKYQSEIRRGNELIEKIEAHLNHTKEIPLSNNWETLKSIGFTENEMESAYPEIYKVDEKTFELIYVEGFDPPYLLWNSEERIWKLGAPSIRKN